MKQKNKSLLKFIIIITIGGIFGGVLGGLSVNFSGNITNILLQIKHYLLLTSPWLLLAFGVIFLLSSVLLLYKAKKIKCEEEDDIAQDILSKTLGKSLAATSIGIILNFIWFCFVTISMWPNLYAPKVMLLSTLSFILISLGHVFLQRYIINYTKTLNPEKQGDAFDLNFQKTWFNSCDEQEKLSIYRAGYKAYNISNVLFPCLFLFLIIATLLFDIGITPFLVLGVIWLTQTIVYLVESMK